MRSLLIKKVLPLLLLIGVVGGAAAMVRLHGLQFFHASRDNLLRRGYAALEHGDLLTAGMVADTLERRDFSAASHLLRGKIWMTRANRALQKVQPAPPYEDAQEVAQLFASAGGLADVPLTVREMVWLSSALVQKSFPAPSPVQDAYRKALGEFSQVYANGRLGLEGSLLAASCLIALDERPAAVTGLLVLDKKHPKEKQIHRLLAATYMDVGEAGRAVEELRAWAALDPDDGRPYRWIAFFNREYGLTQQAVAAYEGALNRRLDTTDRKAVVKELAQLYMVSQGDYATALKMLDKCPPEERDAPEMLHLRVTCLVNIGRVDEARNLLDDLLRKSPDFAPAVMLRGKMYMNEEKIDKAVPYLEKAVRLDPFDEKVHQHLAEAYRLLHQPARARAEDDEAKRLLALKTEIGTLKRESRSKPQSDDIRLRLGKLYVAVDRPSDALIWLQAALSCNPNNRQAWQLLQRLSSRDQHTAKK